MLITATSVISSTLSGRHFGPTISNAPFLQENNWISIEPPLEFVHKDPTDN